MIRYRVSFDFVFGVHRSSSKSEYTKSKCKMRPRIKEVKTTLLRAQSWSFTMSNDVKTRAFNSFNSCQAFIQPSRAVTTAVFALKEMCTVFNKRTVLCNAFHLLCNYIMVDLKEICFYKYMQQFFTTENSRLVNIFKHHSTN